MKITYTHITSHHSSREGARIHGLVLHTTEGSDSPNGHPPQDLITLGSIFDNEEASSHFGVNVDGKMARYVADADKAWTVCNFNPVTLNLEQIGFAAFDKSDWIKHRHAQLHGAAEFLAYGHAHYGVPLRSGSCAGSSITRAGVFQHKDFGISGSGHTDCGPGYPQGYVINMARLFIAHRLHPNSPVAKRLRKEINDFRRHWGIELGAQESADFANEQLDLSIAEADKGDLRLAKG